MRERPIIMSAPMVRAILAGTKTQTRRAVKPYGRDDGFCIMETENRGLGYCDLWESINGPGSWECESLGVGRGVPAGSVGSVIRIIVCKGE